MKHILIKSGKYLNNGGFCDVCEALIRAFCCLYWISENRRPVFADHGKIVPKWYWNSKKKQYASK